jgi:hypothetical protein
MNEGNLIGERNLLGDGVVLGDGHMLSGDGCYMLAEGVVIGD